MIDNNIIKALGAGSGIDTQSLVSQLTEIERSAPQARIDTKKDLYETQISDFGLLSNAMDTLSQAAKVLTEPEGLRSKTASYTESTALVPSELSTDVQTGVYSFEVEQIASSQSLSFESFADTGDMVGEGTLTIDFGSWGRSASPDFDPTTFTQDTSTTSLVITIDSDNNTLEGLRDEINDADAGVQASIVNDGSGYRLTLLAESGENTQLNITAVDGGAGSGDLTRFGFNTGVTDFEDLETQLGQDAIVNVNGLEVSRSTNKIDDIVEGLEIDLLKASPGEIITVTVSDDKSYAEQNIRDFVSAYNAFLEAVEPVFGYSEQENEDGEMETVAGSLTNDSLAKSIMRQIKSLIGSAVPGLPDGTTYTAMSNIGIRTDRDGNLTIDDDELTAAIEDNFEDLQNLFADSTESSSSLIRVNGFGDNTVAGEYSVSVSTPPSKGVYEGGDIDDAEVVFGPNFDPAGTGKTYTFKIQVDGTESELLTLPTGNYADKTEIATALQTLINNDTNLNPDNLDVIVTYDSVNDRFDITSDSYGTNSTVSITEDSDGMQDLGISVGGGSPGINAAGVVNGVAGFGSSNVLLPALGEDGEGLALIIDPSATTATINFSRGFAGELQELIDEYLSSDGLVQLREDNLDDRIDDLDDDQEKLDRRMTAYEERLIQQYINMERIIGGLSSSGSFLDNLVDTLPFTAKRD